jgi:purine-nucleoside phosphorylase
MPYSKIQGLGVPGVAGHSGRLVWAEHAGLETFIFQGRRHWYEGVGWTPVALPVFLLKRMNARVTVITNAAGGIRDDLKPGDLMILDDHINFMGSNPLIGPHREIWGPRFPDQTYLYSSRLRAVLDEVARETDIPVTHGVYLAGSGPTYETPAEVRACTALGADAVGMSTVPEAILANAAGMKVAGISCITNYAAGILDQPLSHEEVTQATATAMPRMKTLLLKCWDKLADSALI